MFHFSKGVNDERYQAKFHVEHMYFFIQRNTAQIDFIINFQELNLKKLIRN